MPTAEGRPFKSEVRAWQSELRETAAHLRSGAEAWRLSRNAVDYLAERLDAQWRDPSFEFSLPHAYLVAKLADKLDRIADELDEPISAATEG